MDNGAVASSTIEDPYEEERRKYGLIYSGIYNSISGVNNLNQFIQAEKITKDLNPDNGSIQKLHTRNTDLVVLCEDKVLRMLANKDAVFNADGNMQLTATNNVLGQAVPFSGEYGISKNPESFASESFRAYFTDKQRGAVLRLSKDGLTPISDYGMKDWFKDNLKLNNTILGSYDSRNSDYNITLNATSNNREPKTVSFSEDVKGWVSFKSFIPENAISVSGNYYTFLDGKAYKHYVEILDAITNEDTNRNTFYGNSPHASHVEVLLNESPGFIKSFNTLNYEGSQSRVDQFTTTTINGVDYTDGEYYNLGQDKKGWYVEKVLTDMQDGTLKEFIEKEGKWFNYIRGQELSTNASGSIVDGLDHDPSEFSWQGIGKVLSFNSVPIPGCMDPQFQEYNPAATVDDGSCVTKHNYGCKVQGANNYSSSATSPCLGPIGCIDPNCLGPGNNECCEYLGCLNDSTAFNYGGPGNTNGIFPIVNVDDGSCTSVIYGCTDLTQYNYDPTANTPCSGPSGCLPPNCNGPGSNNCCDPIIYGCTDNGLNINGAGVVNDANNDGLPAFNYYSAANVDNGTCIAQVFGCTNSTAINYNSAANVDDGSCLYATHQATFYINANFQLVLEIVEDNQAIPGGQYTAEVLDPSGAFVIGQTTVTPVSGIQQFVVPCTNPTIVSGTYTASVQFSWSGSGVQPPPYNPTFSQNIVVGCTDIAAMNQNPLATVSDCSCTYCSYGCIDNDGTHNGAHTWNGVTGVNCSIPYPQGANNYNSSATCNNGTCIYPGCTDDGNHSQAWWNSNYATSTGIITYPATQASNYTPCANQEDGTCAWGGCTNVDYGCYPDIYGNCRPGHGTATVGSTGCGTGPSQNWGYKFSNHDPNANADCLGNIGGTSEICCTGEIHGCTTQIAFNYDPCATSNPNNIACIPTIEGCIDDTALNYGSYSAGNTYGPWMNNTNNGANAPFGNFGTTWNYNPNANPGPMYNTNGWYGPNTHVQSECINVVYGCIDDGNCTVSGSTSPYVTNACGYDSNNPAGCTPGLDCDPANNYNSAANTDNGGCCYTNSCVYPNASYLPSATLQGLHNSVAAININTASQQCYWDDINQVWVHPGGVGDCYGNTANLSGEKLIGDQEMVGNVVTGSNGVQKEPNNWGIDVAWNGGNYTSTTIPSNNQGIYTHGGWDSCTDCDTTSPTPLFPDLVTDQGWLDPYGFGHSFINSSGANASYSQNQVSLNWANGPWSPSGHACCKTLGGCTDPCASNFNPAAQHDTGDCDYSVNWGLGLFIPHSPWEYTGNPSGGGYPCIP